MKKFSVVTPTMYKLPYFMDTLKTLVEIDSVGEIIVIENSDCPFEKFVHPKIIYIKVYSNIYCNPAWNMGVRVAKNDYICLLSDDIVFDFTYILNGLIESGAIEQAGIIGLAVNCYEDIPDNSNVQIVRSMGRGFGFGSCMFLAKENYVHIPDDLKINWGDEWLYYKQVKPNYEISKLQTNRAVGMTVNDPSLSEVLEMDTKHWQTTYHSK